MRSLAKTWGVCEKRKKCDHKRNLFNRKMEWWTSIGAWYSFSKVCVKDFVIIVLFLLGFFYLMNEPLKIII